MALAQTASPVAEAGGYDAAVAAAVAAFQAGQFAQAKEAFALAHALRPSARTYRGLGLSLSALGQQPAARAALEAALHAERLPLPADQRRESEQLLERLVAVTSRLTVRAVPEEARVLVDDAEPVRDGGGALLLSPGRHSLQLTAADHRNVHMTMTLDAGEDRNVEITLPPSAEPQTVDAASVASSARPGTPVANALAASDRPGYAPPAASSARPTRVFTWIAAAAVPVFGGLAATAWFSGQAKRDSIERACRTDSCNAAEVARRTDAANLDTHATLTTIGLALAGASAVTATVLFFTEARGTHAAERPSLALAVSGSGVRLLGHF
ncbi:MAG TPA: PEGA domain-containing protein [Polyangiales bacterium]